MTYSLVSGKEILAARPQSRAPIPGEPAIDPERTYGIARIIYDPETSAILSGGKAR